MIRKIYYTFLLTFFISGSAFSANNNLLSRDFITSIEKAKPSVVNIISYSNKSKNGEKNLLKVGFGSGTIISEQGYIITNYHVLNKGNYFHIILNNGKECIPAYFPGKKFYIADQKTDIALLKIDANELNNIQPIAFDNSDDLQEGEWVIAIGNPYGLKQSVSCGIVSSKGRSDIGFAEIEDFIQTDVSINPGNSGGPLINLDGKLVGINTAIRTKTGGFQGISFAIPSSIVIRVSQELIKYGRVRRGWLGFIAGENFLSDGGENKIIEVISVIKNSPAEIAGIQKGDIIKEIDGREISSIGELINTVSIKPVGSGINIIISRSGRISRFEIILIEKQAHRQMQRALENIFYIYGIELDRNSVTGETIISYISPMSSGYRSGLKKGDMIISINGSLASSLERFVELFNKFKYNISELEIFRNPDHFTIRIENN